MHNYDLFVVLDEVESTNNYAMQQAREGLATHGQAWFAYEQRNGKGQRGKKWVSNKGENIILSLIVKPDKLFLTNPFFFSMLVANICRQFLAEKTDLQTCVKWPNDIYIDDRKAGGILIENVFVGIEWKWAVIGIGLNVNQTLFDNIENTAVSLKNITGINYNPLQLAKELQYLVLSSLNELSSYDLEIIHSRFNEFLYKKNQIVSLKKDTAVFNTTIISVNKYGQLITYDTMERLFNVGDIAWIK